MARTQADIAEAARRLRNVDISRYVEGVQSDAAPIEDTIPAPATKETGAKPAYFTEVVPAALRETNIVAKPASPTKKGTASAGDILLAIIMLVVASIAIAWVLRLLYRCVMAIWSRLTTTASTCSTAISHKVGEVGAIWFLVVLRGRLIVRASTYLMALQQDGATTASANRLASSIDSFAANQLRNGAMYHVNEVFNGSRLAMISEARLRGFKG